MAQKNPVELGPRNFVGYGRNPPDAQWPRNAKIAVSFVINYEEGGENSVEHGDKGSEVFLTELGGATSRPYRDPIVESDYDYGARVGVWRMLNLFEEHRMPVTIYGVGLAMEKNPEVTKAFVTGGHEIASHAYRWIHYQEVDRQTEKKLIKQNIDSIRKLTGKPPRGWYYGRCSPNSRGLVATAFKEEGIPLKYDADSYGDDRPYWEPYPGGEADEGLLLIPYSFDNNDLKFHAPAGFSSSEDFFTHLKNAFDTLYEEGLKGKAGMMSIGLHCRIIGKPGRFPGLKKFVEYISSKEGVWIATREQIADHWREKYPYKP